MLQAVSHSGNAAKASAKMTWSGPELVLADMSLGSVAGLVVGTVLDEPVLWFAVGAYTGAAAGAGAWAGQALTK